jgi:hypothetical protein
MLQDTGPRRQRWLCTRLSIYVVAGNVQEIVDGVYVYDPDGHSIERKIDGDIRNELAICRDGTGYGPTRSSVLCRYC